MTRAQVRNLIDEAFEMEALSIGGLVAVHGMPDPLLRKLMASVEMVYDRALLRIEAAGQNCNHLPSRLNLEPHPVIEKFLEKVRRNAS